MNYAVSSARVTLPEISRRAALGGVLSIATLKALSGRGLAYASGSLEMSSEDIVAALYRELSATGESTDPPPVTSFINSIVSYVPLKDLSGVVVAHYVGFAPKGYAIVNNNLSNPVVLEFSEEDYSDLAALPHHYQFEPSGTDDELGRDSSSSSFGLDYMASRDPEQALAHGVYKGALFPPGGPRTMSVPGGALSRDTSSMTTLTETPPSLSSIRVNYGIVSPDGLPKQNYSARTLSSLSRVSSWGTTAEFKDLARDHCGATASFNLVQYYRYRYGHSGLMFSTRKTTFVEIHKLVGNGPLTFNDLMYGWTGRAGIRKYVQNRGYKFSSYPTGGWSGIKSQIDADCAVIVLITGGINKWHYVNAVGWRSYSGGSKYVRVVDNWYDTTSRYLRTGNIVGSYKAHIY